MLAYSFMPSDWIYSIVCTVTTKNLLQIYRQRGSNNKGCFLLDQHTSLKENISNILDKVIQLQALIPQGTNCEYNPL